jgi:hypothetical protein
MTRFGHRWRANGNVRWVPNYPESALIHDLGYKASAERYANQIDEGGGLPVTLGPAVQWRLAIRELKY